MRKILMAAALMGLCLPVVAQDKPGEVTPPMSLEQVKADIAKHHDEMMQQRAAMDAHMEKCYKAEQAAKSFDELKQVHESCRKEGEAMREKRMEGMRDRMGKMRGMGMGGMRPGMGMQGSAGGNMSPQGAGGQAPVGE